jgi:hypothetical protein
MTIKSYNKRNFHKHTFCIFKEVAFESISDLKINYKSKSGSSYYFVENGVYRLSNHWSRVANCRWRLGRNSNNQIPNSNNEIPNSNRFKLGFAEWKDFYPDNDFEKLYFIEINEDNEVNYFHKNGSNYSNQILRTTSETTKVIKQIRILLEETAWAKYLKEENIEILRKQIINQLINSNQSFQEIRRNYL